MDHMPDHRAEVLRPSWDVYRRWLGGGTAIAVVVIVVGVAVVAAISGAGVVGSVGAGAAVLVLVGLALGWVALNVGRSSVTLGEGRIVHQGIVRRRSLTVADGIVGVLGVQAVATRGSVQRTLILVLRRRPEPGEKHGSGPRLRINGGYFSREQLEQVAAHAGPGVVSVTAPYSVGQIDTIVPGTSTWTERHPVALAFMIVLGLLASFGLGIAAAALA